MTAMSSNSCGPQSIGQGAFIPQIEHFHHCISRPHKPFLMGYTLSTPLWRPAAPPDPGLPLIPFPQQLPIPVPCCSLPSLAPHSSRQKLSGKLEANIACKCYLTPLRVHLGALLPH